VEVMGGGRPNSAAVAAAAAAAAEAAAAVAVAVAVAVAAAVAAAVAEVAVAQRASRPFVECWQPVDLQPRQLVICSAAGPRVASGWVSE
jgi:membrane protein DedA with SNARE-associated domain